MKGQPVTAQSNIETTFQLIIAKTKAKKRGKVWTGHCPAHDDKKPSLSIGRGDDGHIWVKCHSGSGCDTKSICAAIPVNVADLYPQKIKIIKPRYVPDQVYQYKDETGNLLFEAERKRLANPHECPDADLKQFRQRRPNGKGGWEWNLTGVRRVLYRLPELLTADPDATVWIVEGEKDVDRLRSLGLVATCNPMGAGSATNNYNWHDDYNDSLRGREVVIIPDNDDPGRAHAQAVAASLFGKAKKIQILELNGLRPKGDVSDWLDAGGTEDALCQMAEAAPEWTPDAAPIASDDQDQDEWEAPAPFFEFDLPDFPLDVFSTWERSFVEHLATSTQTPCDLAALLNIAICGAAVARNVRVEARAGWEQPLNIYLAVALPSANRKSAVFEEVTRPLFDYERKLILDKRDEIANAASEYRTLAGEGSELEKRAAKADPADRDALKQEAKAKARELAARKIPVLPKLVADDVTAEVLATILAEQDGRIALFSAEGGIFETIAGRYTNGTPNIDVLLKGHSGDDLRVDRRDRSEHIEKPALTIGLAIQPDVLRGLIDKPGFRGRGLLGRFFYSLPVSTVGRRKINPAAMPDNARKTYGENVKRLAAIVPDVDDAGESVPRMIKLSKEANDYLAKFEEEIEPQLGPDGDLHSIADWGGKLAGAVVRLAGILHLAKHAATFDYNGHWPAQVSAETLNAAIKIARYLIPHAQAAYAEMGADPKIEDAKFLLRWIEKTAVTEFTKRDAYQGTKGRFKPVTTIEPALKMLEDHGYIRAIDSQMSNRPGRRPSEKYEVNPLMSRP